MAENSYTPYQHVQYQLCDSFMEIAKKMSGSLKFSIFLNPNLLAIGNSYYFIQLPHIHLTPITWTNLLKYVFMPPYEEFLYQIHITSYYKKIKFLSTDIRSFMTRPFLIFSLFFAFYSICSMNIKILIFQMSSDFA